MNERFMNESFMNRRSAIKAGVLGVAGFSVLSIQAQAAASKFAGSIYYTAQNPGRWANKVSGHAPVVQSEMKGGKRIVTITTPHEMTDEHFIVKHTLLDEKMKVLGERVFDPSNDKAAISSYPIHDYQGKLYAVSVCNKHDTWLAESSAT